MINKEFVPYNEALALKELGFDEPCFGFYLETKKWTPASYSKEGTVYPSNNDLLPEWVSSPTFSQAFRWFREKHNLHANKTGNNFYTSFNMVEPDMVVLSFKRYTDTENHYEEAEIECLRKLIEIVKNESNK